MSSNAEAGAPEQAQTKNRRQVAGEEMACLQIAIGILGVLLLIVPAMTSLGNLHPGVIIAGLALFLGLGLAIAGGFMGLNEKRQPRGSRLMKISGAILTVTAIVLLAFSSDGLIGWDFPVGAIFLTLGLFDDLAAWRFRKAIGPQNL